MAIKNGKVKKAIVAFGPAALIEGEKAMELQLFDADGTPVKLHGTAAAVADVATAFASDPGTTQALANANKVTITALLASLRAAGYLAP